MLTIKTPGGYLQRPGLRAEVGELIQPFARYISVFTSPQAWQAVNPELSQSLERAGIQWQLTFLNGECSDAAIAELQQNVMQYNTPLILAVGGGRVLDCAKAVNDALPEMTLINFATLAATCAAWSPLAIVYNASGGHLRSQRLTKMPQLVLVDSEIIARSEVRFLQSGIVDALAKWYEFEPYQRQNPDRMALDLKVAVAQQAVTAYETWGDEAVAANRLQQVTPALEKVIEANIVLAGLANSVQDELATPGVAHIIHDRLTHQPELHHWLHGEKVGYSLLVQSLLESNGGHAEARLLALLWRFNTPLRLPELAGGQQKALRAIAEDIHFPPASRDHLPFAMTPEKLAQALLATATGQFIP
ncbi:MAG: iron-containing alcohol dehydrogenase family protein [Mixta sp.]